VILEAAREVFIADPRAPVSAVAASAGVGISALYKRYASKEDLLRTLCHDGLMTYIQIAESALLIQDGWTALVTFLRQIVAADVHSLTVHLAGTFTPTPQMYEDSQRAGKLAAELFERGRAAGRMRLDVVLGDISFLLEGAAAIRLRDPTRTAALRQRYTALFIDALAATDSAPLPVRPPGADELNWRWARASAD
jgi:AcrR family transcriptional regulator